ncbi:AAA family ATPase [Thermus scotoductus]|uniref:AAA family ATPase n=1 Tax=Thermus scotoductus TaxID=37636 RepID=A0A430S858_THESC|nr:DUF499 domain-containing protein [Thermus scotoductus]RTH31778.1 AAA family ATPase [Thermus scotoductus]
MALSNREMVGRGLDLLKKGLGPFVEREYRRVYGDEWPKEAAEVLKGDRVSLQDPDAQALLKLMDYRWQEVFDEKLGRFGRTLVKEVLEFRNRFAHQNPFTLEDTHRALDSITRLLEMVAAEEAQETARLARDLLRRRFEEEAKREAERAARAPQAATPSGLRPWREVVTPHPDVISGRFTEAEFAADLAQVLRGEASPEYGHPLEFYRRTYLTGGLERLLVNALRRLAGHGGDPVVELQTPFGGGKTHSMLALYHLFGGGVDPLEVPGLEGVLRKAGVNQVPRAFRAVLVGTALDPAKPRDKGGGILVHTLWGELAYQLGGPEGYRMVEAGDKRGVAPGSDTLKELFERFSPALILIDEWVAFLRNLHGETDLPAGTFDQNLTFAQALTEAARRSHATLLVAALPASDAEVGGSGGREALIRLQNIFGRLESVWQPATQDEAYEIVRRRLFQPLSEEGYRMRDVVVEAFMRFYQEHRGDFPQETLDPHYRERMRRAYPIHPELFDRLYQDWSTLEGFQRTRGVLRFMAAVVHNLWNGQDTSLMILPGGLPLGPGAPRYELTRHLSRFLEGFDQVLDTDVEGPNAKAVLLDQSRPNLGRFHAAKRVARAVFLATAPSAAAPLGRPRGVEGIRVKLGVAQPGENPSHFADALRALAEHLTYFHAEGDRYWLETRPSLNRLVQDRAAQLGEEEVEAELEGRLRSWTRNRPDLFAGVHLAFRDPRDVPDEPALRLVVLPPGAPYAKESSPAEALAREILSQRRFRNTLLFLAADATEVGNLREAARRYLAWLSVERDADVLNLGHADLRQVQGRLQEADTTLDSRLEECYRYLLVFRQPNPQDGNLEMEAFRLMGGGKPWERVERKVRSERLVYVEWHPEFLKETLEIRGFFAAQPRQGIIPLGWLWQAFCTYPYLPRLKDERVLVESIQRGVAEGLFGYAEELEEDGTGRVFLHEGGFVPSLRGFLLSREVAEPLKRRREEAIPRPEPGNEKGGQGVKGGEGGEEKKVPLPRPKYRQFYLKKEVGPADMVREAELLAQEIVRHLAREPGVKVRVVVEINAETEAGFPEDLERVVRENSQALKVEFHLE